MTGHDTTERIRKIAEDICIREGCYLYDLELVGVGGSRALRVYIDRETEGGASIADCANISRGFNEILDADENLVPGGEYDLEVSTPGLERVLKEPRHYDKVIGKTILIKSSAALVDFNPEVPELGLAKQITGPLLSYDERGFRVGFSGVHGVKAALQEFETSSSLGDVKQVFVPFAAVTKAQSVFEFTDDAKGMKTPQPKPGKGPKGPKKK